MLSSLPQGYISTTGYITVRSPWQRTGWSSRLVPNHSPQHLKSHLFHTLCCIPGERVAACGSLGSDDMLMMDASGVGYQVGAGHWGSGGCHTVVAVVVGTALTVRPPAYSHSCPGYRGWLGAKVSTARLGTVHS